MKPENIENLEMENFNVNDALHFQFNKQVECLPILKNSVSIKINNYVFFDNTNGKGYCGIAKKRKLKLRLMKNLYTSIVQFLTNLNQKIHKLQNYLYPKLYTQGELNKKLEQKCCVCDKQASYLLTHLKEPNCVFFCGYHAKKAITDSYSGEEGLEIKKFPFFEQSAPPEHFKTEIHSYPLLNPRPRDVESFNLKIHKKDSNITIKDIENFSITNNNECIDEKEDLDDDFLVEKPTLIKNEGFVEAWNDAPDPLFHVLDDIESKKKKKSGEENESD